MEAIRSYKIEGTSRGGDKRPDIYVQLDADRIELRRPKGSRAAEEFLIELDLTEAEQLRAALMELLPKELP